jgi:hypothetical protein
MLAKAFDSPDEYRLWLRSRYGDVPDRFPPMATVEIDGEEYLVVGYAMHAETEKVIVKLCDRLFPAVQ